jgi:hypothetical protein
MKTDTHAEGWIELYRACTATPLGAEGSELEPGEMPPGMEVRVVEERGDRLVVESRSSTPAQSWRYLVRRDDFDRATSPPETLPREGIAPTASANTSGSPD